MRFSLQPTAVLPLLAVTVSAADVISGLYILRATDVLSKPFAAILAHRQGASENATLGSGSQLSTDGALDFTAWDNTTDAACVSRLRSVARSSNPSGNCICYNLPMLDVRSGVFEADLRLYRVSEPRDRFMSISPGDIQVNVGYLGASVSPMKPTLGSGSSSGSAVNITKRVDEESVSDSPTLLQSYMLVGQIDKSKIKDSLTLAELEVLLIPTLTLTAKDATGGHVSTNVSLNEASFLTGAFSKYVVMSDFAAAQAAQADQMAAVRNGTAAFVVPGVQLLIFPVGLVIISVWLLLGLAVVGYGTYERIEYVNTYKRSVLRASG